MCVFLELLLYSRKLQCMKFSEYFLSHRQSFVPGSAGNTKYNLFQDFILPHLFISCLLQGKLSYCQPCECFNRTILYLNFIIQWLSYTAPLEIQYKDNYINLTEQQICFYTHFTSLFFSHPSLPLRYVEKLTNTTGNSRSRLTDGREEMIIHTARQKLVCFQTPPHCHANAQLQIV